MMAMVRRAVAFTQAGVARTLRAASTKCAYYERHLPKARALVARLRGGVRSATRAHEPLSGWPRTLLAKMKQQRRVFARSFEIGRPDLTTTARL